MKSYYCPMHPEVSSEHSGMCPKCGMKLIKKGEEEKHTEKSKDLQVTFRELFPLFLIIGGVLLFTVIWSFSFNLTRWYEYMQIFMGGFFITFSTFKLLDLQGFATAYQTYDLIARRSRLYALLYPFIELFFGFAFLFSYQLRIVSLMVFIVMGISALGVFRALGSNKRFQCACLGTKLKIPMTKITLIEDVLMSAMALLMFLL